MLSIRDAKPSETGQLTAMVRQSGAYAGEYRTMVANQVIDQQYLDANRTRVVADASDNVLGFYSLLVPGRGEPGEAELDFMFVADAEQGRGVGRAMVDDLRRVCREAEISRVHIVSHPPSEAFYRAIGAVYVRHLPPYGRITWSRPLLVLDIEPADGAG